MSNKKTNSQLFLLIEKKLVFFQDVIQKTVLHVQKLQQNAIFNKIEASNCVQILYDLSKKITDITTEHIQDNTDIIINTLQSVNNELSGLFKLFGTESFDDLLWVCFGNNATSTYIKDDNQFEQNRFVLLKRFFRPISYKLVLKDTKKKKEKDKDIFFDCIDIINSSYTPNTISSTQYKIKIALMKINCIQVIIYNEKHNKTLLITGILDDVVLDILNNKFVKTTIQQTRELLQTTVENKHSLELYLSSISLKEFLLFQPLQLKDIFNNYSTNLTLFKQKSISNNVIEFTSSELFNKRAILISLLLNNHVIENQHLVNILFDLLSSESEQDTVIQNFLYNSLPFTIKQTFKNTIENVTQYISELTSISENTNKISLEQQICLLKTTDSVKEKAIVKLKEVKTKSDENGSKARQWLDGLFKIPFNTIKKEPILLIMDEIRQEYKRLLLSLDLSNTCDNISLLDVLKHIEQLKENLDTSDNTNTNANTDFLQQITQTIKHSTCAELKQFVVNINTIIVKNQIEDFKKLKVGQRNMTDRKKDIVNFAIHFQNNTDILYNVFHTLPKIHKKNYNVSPESSLIISSIEEKYKSIQTNIAGVRNTLDNAVHGHNKAKNQIEKIIGQWIHGKQDGYCFGFEGPPGVGKCFAIDTPIMLYDCSIKPIQEIQEGDQLMGDDGLPRKVLNLGRGRELMYKVRQTCGNDYIVNQSHILSLVAIKNLEICGKLFYKGDNIDISLLDYLSSTTYVKNHLRGYKVALNFNSAGVEDADLMSYHLDPYLLGYWLITCKEQRQQSSSANACNIIYEQFISKYNLSEEINNKKFIPPIYKRLSRELRLKLLAGFIDGNGFYNDITNTFSIIKPNDTILLKDIIWLIYSLGFTFKDDQVNDILLLSGTLEYNILDIPSVQPSISNNSVRKSVRNSVEDLFSKIIVSPLNIDDYYGFEIDGNSRFLLGDFTVVHNTSLAKNGLSKCLKDANGQERPFAMIQMGGDANGSTLHGHNYTYVGSNWGSIVQILMDKKCMNPIIFIDEVDKISNTEHGKEIIGILTHLLDSTQNDVFQDKYFAGIEFDLSKALFILSYNNPETIDRILLDRVHRIQFKNLSLEEKIVICEKYLFKEIFDKMGLNMSSIQFEKDVLKFIIDEYTYEPGVRKLKEILFEIIGEINLEILTQKNTALIKTPIIITVEDIKTRYLKSRTAFKHKLVDTENKIGIINGLWANAMGKGGVIPIQAKWRPSKDFLDLHLTGQQGDVMKESMNVAITLAWNLTSEEQKNTLHSGVKGVHIHCPEGATPKDGPSAGTAITVCLYSLFNNKTIPADLAITGEITLDGKVTEIGGLDLKILGGIKAGIKNFIFPLENKTDFDSFMEKYVNNDLIKGITFKQVETIEQVLDYIDNI